MKKTMLTVSVISLLFITAFSSQVCPQSSKKIFTMKEKLNLKIPNEPVISPDGKKILFTIRSADLSESKWNTQVYLFNKESKDYYQFTRSGESCTNPQFSPDQKWITFLSAREYAEENSNSLKKGIMQLWAAPLDGGEAVNWTSFNKSVLEYTWSQKGDKIGLLSEEYDIDKEKKGEEIKKKKIDAKIFPQVKSNKELKILDVMTGKIIHSFILDPGAEKIKFNGSGDKIIYQSNLSGEYNDEQKFDLFIIDMTGKKIQITSDEGPETSPAFSPDGKRAAFISQTVPDIEFAETDLNIIDLNENERINLTDDFDLSISEFIWEDDNSLLFTVNEKTDVHLYRLADSKIEKLSSGNAVISDLSLSRESKSLCYRKEDASSLPELFIEGRKISNFSAQLGEYFFGSQEIITYKSGDEKFDIEGILFKPYNFDPKKKYPLIIALHGGPFGVFKNTFYQTYGIKIFNEKGFLVFAPNPRGSRGYSDEFGQSIRYDLGGGDYQDVMTGVDKLISKGYVDENRMGVMGGSYGGYLTNWIISQTNRFKAAVSMYGIFSFFTDWSNSWQPAFEKMYFGYYYWERAIDANNLYVNRSPAFYAKDIKTPTLILHGEKDVYTDVANSREMYQALKTLGVDVQFIIYPRAGHGIRNEPNQYIDIVERSVDWFLQYLFPTLQNR